MKTNIRTKREIKARIVKLEKSLKFLRSKGFLKLEEDSGPIAQIAMSRARYISVVRAASIIKTLKWVLNEDTTK